MEISNPKNVIHTYLIFNSTIFGHKGTKDVSDITNLCWPISCSRKTQQDKRAYTGNNITQIFKLTVKDVIINSVLVRHGSKHLYLPPLCTMAKPKGRKHGPKAVRKLHNYVNVIAQIGKYQPRLCPPRNVGKICKNWPQSGRKSA